jgi:hypothetical protein
MYNPNEKYIFDMIGLSVLSLSSYMYHFDIYKRLCDKKIDDHDTPNKDNIVLFLNDILSIHFRCFLVVLTNYYYSPHLFFALLLSGIFHVSSIYHSFVNILDLFVDHEKNKETFLNRHNIISSIPIAVDVLFISANSTTDIAIPYLLINILIGLLHVVNPFYKLTHVAFHVLLIVQNYYMCLSNIKN